jgi:glyoxylase-like metal-dependent hydrolase (beta-lactamase superfamily II)
MPFLTEPEPERGAALEVLPGVRRLVAPNPGPMTYHGTNTWLLDGPEGTSVLDPGPDDPVHVRAILAATGGRVARILATHTHADHIGAVPALQAATGAPTCGWQASAVAHFSPDLKLDDGMVVAGMAALHTPGHAPDHVCLARADGVVFSGDHVMSWSSSVVVDMAAYVASLRRLLGRDDRLFLPGHGPPLPRPRALVEELLAHRLAREAAIAAALGPAPLDAMALVGLVYGEIAPALRAPAERNVLAHLGKLRAEGRAAEQAGGWVAA